MTASVDPSTVANVKAAKEAIVALHSHSAYLTARHKASVKRASDSYTKMIASVQAAHDTAIARLNSKVGALNKSLATVDPKIVATVSVPGYTPPAVHPSASLKP